MSESARGEGGRVWVPAKKGDDRHPLEIPEGERNYFLEEKYPGYGNLVPRDIATREIFWVCEHGEGINGGNQVYLDITHLPQATKNKLAAILEIYEKFTGDDPREVPMKIFPAVHYSMGGLYTTYEAYDPERDKTTPASQAKRKPGEGMLYGDPKNMMTNVPGLYAFGEVNYAYHGATRLGANALLSCIFDGLFCGLSVANYARDHEGAPASELDEKVLHDVVQKEEAKVERITLDDRGEQPLRAARGVGPGDDDVRHGRQDRGAAAAGARDAQVAGGAGAEPEDLRHRPLPRTRTSVSAAALGDMIVYSQAIIEGSIARKESRGSHYRDDFPDRIDDDFHGTTRVRYDASAPHGNCTIEFEPIPSPLIPLRARTYGKTDPAKVEKAKAEPGEQKAELTEAVASTGYDQQPGVGSQEESTKEMPLPKYSGDTGGNQDFEDRNEAYASDQSKDR